jgi:hypothetical protein
MPRLIILPLLAVSFAAGAIVIRHDVDDAKYRVPLAEFPALADIPGEGHGVLIAPQWVVTAAHTTLGHPREVILNGVPRRVERVVIHPGYKTLPQELIAQALESGDASRAMAFQASNDDIALVMLSAPVTDVAPALLFRGSRESGKLAKFIGKGATGNGLTGQAGPNRTVLRRAFGTIEQADGNWLISRFNAGPRSHPLEGMSGSGDSGGPVLIRSNGRWRLAGLAAWKYVDGNAAAFRTGVYGQKTYNIRLSSYARWIDSVLSPGSHAGLPTARPSEGKDIGR